MKNTTILSIMLATAASAEPARVGSHAELEAAFASGRQTVVITRDIQLDAFLQLPDNCTVQGEGAPTVTLPTTGILAAFEMSRGSTLADLTIAGDGKQGTGILIRDGDHGCSIRGVAFRDLGRSGQGQYGRAAIYARPKDLDAPIRDLVITGCTFRDIDYGAIIAFSIDGGRIDRNRAHRITNRAGHTHHGNFLRSTGLRNFSVSGNTLTEIARMGIEVFGGDALTVSHNRIVGCGRNAATGTRYGISIGNDCQDVVVSGNVLADGTQGIEVAQRVRGCVVSANVIRSMDRNGLGMSAGARHVIVSGNLFVECAGRYHAQIHNCSDVTISANRFSGHSFNGERKRALNINTSERVTIRGNTFDGSYNSFSNAAIYYYKSSGACSSNLLTGGSRITTIHASDLSDDRGNIATKKETP